MNLRECILRMMSPLKNRTLVLLVTLLTCLNRGSAAQGARFGAPVLDAALTEILCDLNLTPLDNSEASAQAIMARFLRPDVAAHFTALGFKTHMGVGVHITDDRGRILMGLRQGSHGAGHWSAPGGHIDEGETSPFAAAAREVLEETGAELGAQFFLGATLDVFPENGKAYLTLHMGSTITATPRNMEPAKQRGPWQWFRPEKLPRPLLLSDTRFLTAGGRLGGRHYTDDLVEPGLRPPLTSSLQRWLESAQHLSRGDQAALVAGMNAQHADLLSRVRALSDNELFSEVQLVIDRMQASPFRGYMPGLSPAIQVNVDSLIRDHRRFLRLGSGSSAPIGAGSASYLLASVRNLDLWQTCLYLVQESVNDAEAQENWDYYLNSAIPHGVLAELARRIGP